MEEGRPDIESALHVAVVVQVFMILTEQGYLYNTVNTQE